MKRKIISVATGLLLVSAGLWSSGNSEDIRDRRDYGNFSSIRIDIPADVIIEQQSLCQVEADIPRSVLGHVSIRNSRGTLIIEKKNPGFSLFRTDNIRLILSLPQIEELTVSTSGRVRSNDTWTNSRIAVISSGSADIELGGLEAMDVMLKTTGSGNISLGSLKGERLNLKTTGSGDIQIDWAGGIRTEVSATGSGDIRLTLTTDELKSLQTGSGDMELTGSSEKTAIETTGSGNFHSPGFVSGETDVIITGSGDIYLQEGSRLKGIRITGSGSLHNY